MVRKSRNYGPTSDEFLAYPTAAAQSGKPVQWIQGYPEQNMDVLMTGTVRSVNGRFATVKATAGDGAGQDFYVAVGSLKIPRVLQNLDGLSDEEREFANSVPGRQLLRENRRFSVPEPKATVDPVAQTKARMSELCDRYGKTLARNGFAPQANTLQAAAHYLNNDYGAAELEAIEKIANNCIDLLEKRGVIACRGE
jgi:hypothetical protein